MPTLINTYDQQVGFGLRVFLYVCAFIFFLISLIPSLRWVGAYGLRSTSALSSANSCVDSWGKDDLFDRAFRCLKIVLILLGLLTVAFSIPAFTLTVMALMVSLRLLFFIKSCVGSREFNNDLFLLLFFQAFPIVLDLLMLIALATGAWQFIVAAYALNFVVLGIVSYFISSWFKHIFGLETAGSDFFVGFLALAFSVLNLVGVLIQSEMSESVNMAHFDLKNNSDHTVSVYDKDGFLLDLQPGESKHLDLDTNNLFGRPTVGEYLNGHANSSEYIGKGDGMLIGRFADSSGFTQSSAIEPSSLTDETVLMHGAVKPEYFLSVPLGSLASPFNEIDELKENSSSTSAHSA